MLKVEQKNGYKLVTIKNKYLDDCFILDYENTRQALLKYRMKKEGVKYELLIEQLTNEIIFFNRCISSIRSKTNYSRSDVLKNMLKEHQKNKNKYIWILNNLYEWY